MLWGIVKKIIDKSLIKWLIIFCFLSLLNCINRRLRQGYKLYLCYYSAYTIKTNQYKEGERKCKKIEEKCQKNEEKHGKNSQNC